MRAFGLICIFLSLALPSFGMDAPSLFRHFHIEDGLQSESIFQTVQCETGELWIATHFGFSVFDGYNVKSYERTSIISTKYNTYTRRWLYCDSQGTIWTFHGKMGRYNREDDCLDELDWFPEKIVSDVVEIDGVLYLAVGDGLIAVDISTGLQVDLPKPLEKIKGYKLCRFKEDLIVLSLDGNVNRLSLPDWELESSFHMENSPAVTSMLPSDDGVLWLGTEGNGLFRININNPADTKCYVHPKSENGICSNYIRSLCFDEDANLWIGTGNGLSILDRSTGKFLNVYSDKNNPSGPSGSSVSTLYKDRSGGMWIGYVEMGLDYYCGRNKYFNEIKFENIADCLIGGLSEDDDGSLWIGTTRHGAIHYFPQSGRSEVLKFSDDELKNDVKSVSFSPDGKNVFFSTARHGINVLNKQTGKIRNYSAPTYPKASISLVVENDSIVYSCNRSGLYLLNIRSGKSEKVEGCLKDVTNVSYFMKDSSGVFWIGTLNGLVTCKIEYDSCSHPIVSDFRLFDIGEVIYVFEDDGVKWIATTNGLYSYNGVEWNHFTKKDGFSSDNLVCITKDCFERLWITSKTGINCLDKSTGRISSMSSNCGMTVKSFRSGALVTAKDGTIYAGGLNGLVSFNPLDMPVVSESNAPILYLENLGRKVKRLYPGSKVVLEPENRNLSLVFAVPNFSSGLDNTFKYRLIPNDKDWTLSGNRTVTYSNLRPGAYTFEIYAINADGTQSKTFSGLEVSALPFWYETILAKIGAVLLVLGLFLFVSFLVILRIKENARLRIENIKSFSEREIQKSNMRLYAKGALTDDEFSFLNKAVSIIDAHLSDTDFTVENFAAEMCMSRSNLHLRCKSITGESATKLIRKVRMEKAIVYLRDERYTVNDIVVMVGFSSNPYFFSCFKQYTGVTPGEFRKK